MHSEICSSGGACCRSENQQDKASASSVRGSPRRRCRCCYASQVHGHPIAEQRRSGYDAGITYRTSPSVTALGKCPGLVARTNSMGISISHRCRFPPCCRHNDCLSCDGTGAVLHRAWTSRYLGRRVMRISSNPDSRVQWNDDTLLSSSAIKAHSSAMQKVSRVCVTPGLLLSFSS